MLEGIKESIIMRMIKGKILLVHHSLLPLGIENPETEILTLKVFADLDKKHFSNMAERYIAVVRFIFQKLQL